MRPDDGTLLQHPDRFEFVRSRSQMLTMLVIAAVALIGLVLVLINFSALEAWFSTATGRRSWARGIVTPLMAVLLALAAGGSLWKAFTGGVWQLRDGRPLQLRRYPFANDPNELHRRLATGDPATYLPIQVNAKSDRILRSYSPPDEPVVHFTITTGRGSKASHWPLLTLEGQAAEAWQAVKHVHKAPQR